jgi:hypothetical protein
MIPSLAKARFNNTILLDSLGKELISKFRDDYSLLEPSFLKVLIERLLSLEYKETKEALNFFIGVKELSEIKSKVLNGELRVKNEIEDANST